MFEVDWQDYDCERVGQRRVRKEVEREQKKNNDASSGHRTNSTLSTRTSSSSDQHHRKFFGSIGRKKPPASLKSSRRESSPTKLKSTKSNGEFKRGSLRFSGITTMMESPTVNTSTGLENNHPNIQPSSTLKSTADAMQSTSPQSADRSSKESMLSRMTQLTVPTLESQGDEPTNDANTEIKLVQALDNKGSFVDKVVKTTYEHNETDPFVSTQPRVGTKITAGSRIPQKTRPSRVTQPTPSPENAAAAKAASDLIDDWFTALHHPAARPALKPGPNGSIRSGAVLPPNVVRRAAALPETPTRQQQQQQQQQSAKNSEAATAAAAAACFLPARASPIRFAANNPDDWQPVTAVRGKRAPSHGSTPRARALAPAPVVVDEDRDGAQDDDDGGGGDEEEEIMRLMAADLKGIHVQEDEEDGEDEEDVTIVRDESGASRRDAARDDTPRAKPSSVSAGYAVEASRSRSAPMEKNVAAPAAVRRGGRSAVRPAV